MRLFSIICLFLFCTVSAQKSLPLDTLKLKEVKDFFADDYGNLYIYKSKDFSLTKYDSLGKQIGQMMLPVPYKIQSVQNPLSIPLFSENAQEMKFVDQNLNDIQKIDFKQKFSYIKHAYAEDLQQIWLLDESTRRLLQYNFRNDTTINSYPYDGGFEDIIDLLVFENKVYVLSKKLFRIYNLKFEKLFEAEIVNGKRFRRENEMVLIITKSSILRFSPDQKITKIFEDPDTQIVDKNSLAFFELKGNKLYLYTPETIRLMEAKAKKEELEETIEKLENEKSEKGDVLKVLEEIENLGY
ncbi:hypothetical protein [Chryseobacterium caseinilyticum]|uniref:6-bladed beta-propeller n=1 Tax=Chryseobacterium caseinilyticum TaxID=2771428 RepID=A0ABR8Z8I0_9FLAO|nr:hypothetical protein [Chryseobacterium caseinilyticum]MBD8081178.1 hypothetical protein [Chryseobacterium caseinilyticum]